MHIYPFRGIYPNLSLITSNDTFFDHVSEQYPMFFQAGYFNKTSEAAFYIHRVSAPSGTFQGLVVANNIIDYDNHIMVRHENTLADKEQHLVELTLQRNALIKPVLMAYDYSEPIRKILEHFTDQHPLLNFRLESKEETHTVWSISDEQEVMMLKKLFKDEIRKAWIADGHHRCYAIHAIRQNHLIEQKPDSPLGILCYYLPFNELKIFDYNRVIQLTTIMGWDNFMTGLNRYFKMKKLSKRKAPQKKLSLSMYARGLWYRLSWRKKALKKYKDLPVVLDIHMFNELVLTKLLSINEPRTSSRITYVPGTQGLDGVEREVSKWRKAAGFTFFPVSVDEIKLITENGYTLPPKSTWFEPRVVNGILGMELKE
ncbi:MAG TPA: DUF1015 family protein [Saprospiraceae bacterium]|mgnify:CR=1 FL=1|nr:DUF1015 family protein [Saprospiraceae bacterium]